MWTPNKEIHAERIYYKQNFTEQAIAKAGIFCFDVLLPSIVPCVLICTGSSHIVPDRIANNAVVYEERNAIIATDSPQNHDNEECTILCVSELNKPSPLFNVLQKLHVGRW